MKSLSESIMTKTNIGLTNLSPEKFAEVYFKSQHHFVIDDRLYITSTPLKQLVVDDDFPDIQKFKISKLGSPLSRLKIIIKNWDVFQKHFFDLGQSEYGRCEIEATVTIDDPNADITDFDLKAYDFKGKLIFKRAKSVVFTYDSPHCFDRAEDYVFYKAGIGRLSLPFNYNSVNSIEFRK